MAMVKSRNIGSRIFNVANCAFFALIIGMGLIGLGKKRTDIKRIFRAG